ncbi:DUF397 domain-containing protein [Actinosynnema pretiosum subsp. pretiosum]|uniref:DUF397 domain-containing protein n=1 Tax=Actinosynnema pretiosum subsp. pretiosum TaxID=103721 RepID=A0AA45L1W5_9PSEU|nr:hypothetical protein APASM_0106 [Actinosynnema pretiosum subsp. pretiosum]QUF01812.1 DUF397 domain-containing protein [Actinosynnema pretiosum subsp. pretiosum]
MTNWRKSSRSGAGANNCVEVAHDRGSALFRDSKAPESGRLTFTTDEFQRFRTAAALGRFDR